MALPEGIGRAGREQVFACLMSAVGCGQSDQSELVSQPLDPQKEQDSAKMTADLEEARRDLDSVTPQ